LSLILDEAWLNSVYPPSSYDGPAIYALGVNKAASNQIAMLIGTGYLGSRQSNIWIGNHTGVTQGAAINSTWVSTEGKLVFSEGKWTTAFCWGLGARGFARFSADGSSNELQENNTADNGAGGEMATLICAGGGPNLWGWSNGNVWYSTDNGTTRTSIGAVGTDKWIYKINQSMAFGPSGANGMNFTGNVLKASVDGGLTFPATVLVRAGYAVEAVTEDIYIAGGGNFIEVTDDFGVTWADKTGNLTDYIPTFEVMKIAALL
jgi:hypothetical protein